MSKEQNKTLTLGSLFDGSGGFPLGGMLAGIEPVWSSEVEPFAIRVTTKRLPQMKHYGDVSAISGADLPPVDIITFGSPCQDMSIAGKRDGLDGSRSSLFYEAIRIVKEMRCATNGKQPRFIVWENVPGAFSSNKGQDFKAVLEAVIGVKESAAEVPAPAKKGWPDADYYLGDGWSVAYRVLDAQWWGVPQRRKRIFLVADFAGRSAKEILFESEGLSRYSAEGFRAWQRAAACAERSVGEAGCGSRENTLTEGVVEAAGFCTEHSANARSIGYEEERSPTLRAGVVPAAIALENHPADSRVKISEDGKVQTLTSRCGTGGGNVPLVMDGTENSPAVTLKIRSGCAGDGKGAIWQEEKSATLGCNNDQTVFVPKAYGVCSKASHSMMSDNPHSGFYEASTSRTLDRSGGDPTCNQGGLCICEPVAFTQNQRDEVRDLGDKSAALAAEPGMKQQTFVAQPEDVTAFHVNQRNELIVSDNIRWSIQKKFQAGVPHINLKRMLGYDLGPNQEWVIVPEQAQVVRFIFERFVRGQTANKIAEELNELGKTTVTGKKWRASSILIVLRNEKYVGDVEMQKTITKDFLTHRSSINKGEAPRYYVKNHHVGIIDRVTWDKVQMLLFEKPRTDMTKGPGKKKTRTIKGSPFGNLRCGAILEHGPDARKPCGEGFFRVTYTGVANGYTDERSLKATGEDTGEFLEKYSYSYPVWKCKRKAGERQDAPPRNGSPDQKMYCRSKKGCMSDEEKKAANERCPSETYYECALEQSFMELLYSMKRDYEQYGDASMIVTLFDNAFEQAMKQAKNNSISVQRLQTVNSQIEELEERLQDAVSHQVAALREAALEDNAELKDALSNGEVTIDDIDTDIRNGLTPNSIGASFYEISAEEGSEAKIYTELVNDLRERIKTLCHEQQTIEAEQGVLAIMKKNFEYFLACLKELPDTNAAGMPLKVNGLDVQGSLLRDVDGKVIEGRVSAVTKGKLKLTPERIAEAPDMLHFEKGIYCAFIESGVVQGDIITYKTNFGVTLTAKGNRRTLTSFMGFKRSDLNGTVVYVDAPYKVHGFSIQYRRYLTAAAKRERGEAV